MTLFDSCFNFTSSSFRKDEAAVLERAHEAGVHYFFIAGSNVEDSRQAIALAERFDRGLVTSVGVHPHLAKEWDKNTYTELRDLATHSCVKAIGEAGLDYNRNYSTREQQTEAFQKQIELAIELGKPLFLHEREASNDFLNILKPMRAQLGSVIVHCFTGTEQELESYLDMDLHIGITGWICDERRGHHLHSLISKIPAERLLIETDAPYLLPRSLPNKPKNRRNEPAFLPHILETVAKCRGESEKSVAERTTQNALRFFEINA